MTCRDACPPGVEPALIRQVHQPHRPGKHDEPLRWTDAAGAHIGFGALTLTSNGCWCSRTESRPRVPRRTSNRSSACVAEQKSRGIAVTALGSSGRTTTRNCWPGWRAAGGGNYYYITRPEAIPGGVPEGSGLAADDHREEPAASAAALAAGRRCGRSTATSPVFGNRPPR